MCAECVFILEDIDTLEKPTNLLVDQGCGGSCNCGK
jgi:hypothetical protein